ncbi:MAG: NosD domain-containing protein [Conexivisphaera sp.]
MHNRSYYPVFMFFILVYLLVGSGLGGFLLGSTAIGYASTSSSSSNVQPQTTSMLQQSIPSSLNGTAANLAISANNARGLAKLLDGLNNPSSGVRDEYLTYLHGSVFGLPAAAAAAALQAYFELHGLSAATSYGGLTGAAGQPISAWKVQPLGTTGSPVPASTYGYSVSVPGATSSGAQRPPQFGVILTPNGYYNLTQYLKSRSAIPLYRTLYQSVNLSNPLQTPSNFMYYTPSEVEQMYNTTSLLGSGVNGSGITIAIVDAYGDPYIQQELDAFSAEFGIPTTQVHIITVGSPIDFSEGIVTGWNVEIALDVEWAHAMAPGARINLYIASDASSTAMFEAVEAAVEGTNGTTPVSPSNIISLSWGIPENDIGSSAASSSIFGLNYPWLNQVFQQAAARNITVLAAAGDWGAYDQAWGQTSPYGGAVYPSTDPFVTGVGGTTLYMRTNSGYLGFPFINASGSYGTETAWSWNDFYYWGTGGGFSTLFARPPWQHGEGVPSVGTRGAPDVAWDADVQTGVLVYVQGYGNLIVGGTSVGAPSWAGSMALIDQRAGHPLGFINPYLYEIMSNQTEYSKAFHDITVGDNNPYQANPGWDPLTGVGSPNVGELSIYLPQVASSGIRVGVELAQGGKPISPSEMAAYGSTVQVLANVTLKGSPVTSGNVTAQVLTSAGSPVGTFQLKYDNVTGQWVGNFTVSSPHQPGEWFVTVTASANGALGQGYAELAVGDGVTILAPYTVTYPFFMVGQTIPISAEITAPNGFPVTSGSFQAVFTLGTPNGKVEGVVPLKYDSSTGLWEGSFLVPINADQGPWVLTISGTDSQGNMGSAYSWLNVGLDMFVFTDSPTYVLGDTMYIIAYTGSPVGSFNATISAGSQTLGVVPLAFNPATGLWYGEFQIGSSGPTGFYTITVSGGAKDQYGNMESGSYSTVVRVAPYTLRSNVTVSAPEVMVSPSICDNEMISAKLYYPNGTPVTLGNVAAIVSVGAAGAYLEEYYLQLTYNNRTGSFVSPSSVPVIDVGNGTLLPLLGNYSISIVAYTPEGDYGSGGTSFFVEGNPHAPINITSASDFNATNGVIGGNGTASNPYVIAGWNFSSVRISGNFSVYYELIDDWVQGNGAAISTPSSPLLLLNDYFISNRGNGLYVYNDYSKASFVRVFASIAANNAGNGIEFYNSSPIFTYGNQLVGNAGNGMLLLNSTYGTYYSALSWDTAIGNGGAGINVTGSNAGNVYLCCEAAIGNPVGFYVNGMGQKPIGWDYGATVWSRSSAAIGNGIGFEALNNAVISSSWDTAASNNVGLLAKSSTADVQDIYAYGNSGDGVVLSGRAADNVTIPYAYNSKSYLSGTLISNGNQATHSGSGAVVANESDVYISQLVSGLNGNDGLKLVNVNDSVISFVLTFGNAVNGIEANGLRGSTMDYISSAAIFYCEEICPTTPIYPGNGNDGVLMNESSSNTVQWVLTDHEGNNGIVLVDGSNNNTISNPISFFNGGSGLEIDGSNYNNVTGGCLCGNGASGSLGFGALFAGNSTGNYLTNTYISNNPAGVGFEDCANNTAIYNDIVSNVAGIYLSGAGSNSYGSNHFYYNRIDVYSPPVLDRSFSASPLSEAMIGNSMAVNATFTSGLLFQLKAVVWFEVDNATTGQEVAVIGTTLTLKPLQSGSAYLPLRSLPPGTYRVYVLAETPTGVPISQTLAENVTIPG